MAAADFVRVIEHRQGWITAADLLALAEPLRKGGYGAYLEKLLRDQRTDAARRAGR